MSRNVQIDCSLSNAKTCVCRDEHGELTKCELNEGDTFGGLCHLDGEAAATNWSKDHPDLEALLIDSLAGAAGDNETAEASFSETPVAVVSDSDLARMAKGLVDDDDDGDLVLEDDDPVAALNEPEPEVSKSDSAPGSAQETESDGPEKALVDAGVPEEYVDKLIKGKVDTPEKVLEHEDLTKVHGIGKKSRDAILKGMSAQ